MCSGGEQRENCHWLSAPSWPGMAHNNLGCSPGTVSKEYINLVPCQRFFFAFFKHSLRSPEGSLCCYEHMEIHELASYSQAASQPARLCQWLSCHLPRYTFAGCENAFKTATIIVGKQEVALSDRILHVHKQRCFFAEASQTWWNPTLNCRRLYDCTGGDGVGAVWHSGAFFKLHQFWSSPLLLFCRKERRWSEYERR